MKIVVIGGDAAGMSAASRAKRHDPGLDVTVLEKTSDVSYSACGMPYNIADSEREMDDLVVRQADVFINKNGINLKTGYRVEHIDPVNKTVSGSILSSITKAPFSGGKIKKQESSIIDNFSFPYDKLLIATGAAPVIPKIPGIDLAEVMALKSLQQGREIKECINSKKVKKAVIIGMGYIGLEMCEALKSRSIEVSMVKPGKQFLPWMPTTLSDMVRHVLTLNGVDLYCGYPIRMIKRVENGSISVICKGAELEADMVIVASGVKPCSELAVDAGIETSIEGSIAVDKLMKTSDDSIYAAGDCADAFHVVTESRCWIPLALRANRAGWAAADNMCGISTELQGVAGTAVFKTFDMQVARTGLSPEEARRAGFDPAEAIIESRSRAHAHPGSEKIYISMTGDKKSGRLLGVQMVGKDGVAHRINAAAVALHAKMEVEKFAQTDLGYAPPFGPVWDPLLTAANQLIKKM